MPRRLAPYDPDARWSAKGDELFWRGYKVHLTESCDTPAKPKPKPKPGLRVVTDVHTTDATIPVQGSDSV